MVNEIMYWMVVEGGSCRMVEETFLWAGVLRAYNRSDGGFGVNSKPILFSEMDSYMSASGQRSVFGWSYAPATSTSAIRYGSN